MPHSAAPLSGLRVIEVSMLGPGALTTNLADLGADVIKVEPPQGDYGRQMTWPIVNGVSLLFLHVSRGKRSVVVSPRTDAARDAFLELVKAADAAAEAGRGPFLGQGRDADAVVEAMRRRRRDRRGLGFEELAETHPKKLLLT